VNRVEIIDKAESALRTAGFDVSEKILSRPSCFDVVARRKDQLAFIKTHENIGNISMLDVLELRTLSKHLSAASVLVCEKTRHRTMEDDTIYSRYGIYAITPLTLEDITIHGNNPLVDATPGGYYVRLDGERLKQERQKRGLSVGKLAEMTGISRRTIYGYEKAMARASVSAAYKLEYVLGVPLAQGIDVFQRSPEQDKGFLAAAKRIISTHHCLRSVEHKLSKLNIFVAHARRAPFDFIAKSQENGVNIVGGVTDGKERNFERRVMEIVSVGKVLNVQPVVIAENERKIESNDITWVRRDELEKISDIADLRSLL
jgi:putative transcriptional regulator